MLKSKRIRTLLLVVASVCLPPALMLSACADDASTDDDDVITTTTTTTTSEGICLLNNCTDNTHCAGCQDGRNTCLMAENRCVACDPNLPPPGGCPEGQECSPYGICVPAGLTCPVDDQGVPNFNCTVNPDCLACSPMNQVCDPQSHRCVACTSTNTQNCLQSDVCINGKCSPKCPASCTTQNDCMNCGGPGNYAHACYQHKCAECNGNTTDNPPATVPCAQNMVCENGVCIPPCGIPGPVAGDCTSNEDCQWCGGSEAAHGTWLCKKPVNQNDPTDHGKCGPNAAGCDELGQGLVLPPPWSSYTNTCSTDASCTGSDVGILYDVGALIIQLLGSDQLNLGFTQITICHSTIFYAMNKCAQIEITGPEGHCGLCVPCAEDADCEPIDLDPLMLGQQGLFCDDPLAQIAGALLIDLLWGDAPDHNLNFFCQQIVAGYGVCVPCGNPTQACGQGGGQQGECDHDVCEAGDPLGANCDDCTAAVCAEDSYCCSDAWDDVCVSEVDDYCVGGCGGQSSCAHSPCTAGEALNANCSACAGAVCAADAFCCNSDWDSVCVSEAQAEALCDAECAGGCAHSECSTGNPPLDAPLDAACSACATAVCDLDPYCCQSKWDDTCVDEAIAEADCPLCT